MTIDNASVLQTPRAIISCVLFMKFLQPSSFPSSIILRSTKFLLLFSCSVKTSAPDSWAKFSSVAISSKNYLVKKLLAFHPHTPRTDSLRLLRDLYLMDLVQFASSPGVLPDLKRR